MIAMDTQFVYAGQRFRWDPEKALSNLKKHGIRFEQACEVFSDPFFRLLDATDEAEAREGSWDWRRIGRCSSLCTSRESGAA